MEQERRSGEDRRENPRAEADRRVRDLLEALRRSPWHAKEFAR